MSGEQATKTTALNAWHKAHGGQMVPFAGWEMPVQYAGIPAEHKAVREAAGLFDIGHMGQVGVRGPQALEFLQSITTNNVANLEPGRVQYSLLPAPDGGLIDDILVTRFADHYMVVVNACNADADLAWMMEQAGRFNVQVRALDRGMLALQGPLAEGLLQPLTEAPLAGLKYYHAVIARVCGRPAVVSRTGYTGEDGFELCLEQADVPTVWDALMAAGAPKGLQPVGLGARNTLRLEMGYSLYGHEIHRGTHPLEAGLSWVVKLDKGPFIGREAMVADKAAGPKRRLVGYMLEEPGVARDGYPVCDPASGQRVGEVTSGAPSPSLANKSVGLAYVPAAMAAVGSPLCVEVRGRKLKARVAALPFVPSHAKKA